MSTLSGEQASAQTSTPLAIIIPIKDEAGYIEQGLSELVQCREFHRLNFRVVVVSVPAPIPPEVHTLADRLVIESTCDGWRTIASARNLGAKHANAELLFHTDADVRVPNLPDFLRRVVAAFEDDRVVAVTGRIAVNPGEARMIDVLMHWLGNVIIRTSLVTGPHFGRGEFQIVRSSDFWAIGGYRGDLVAGEDWDLFQRIRSRGRIKWLRHLPVLHSPRRFRNLGYRRVIGIYFREALAMKLLKRSWLDEWGAVR